MTKREFFETVVNLTTVDATIVEFAASELEKMDASKVKDAERRAEKAAAKAEADADTIATLFAVLNDEPMTAGDLLEKTGLDVSPQKIARLLKPAIDEGKVVKEGVHKEGKKTPVVGYRLA